MTDFTESFMDCISTSWVNIIIDIFILWACYSVNSKLKNKEIQKNNNKKVTRKIKNINKSIIELQNSLELVNNKINLIGKVFEDEDDDDDDEDINNDHNICSQMNCCIPQQCCKFIRQFNKNDFDQEDDQEDDQEESQENEQEDDQEDDQEESQENEQEDDQEESQENEQEECKQPCVIVCEVTNTNNKTLYRRRKNKKDQ